MFKIQNVGCLLLIVIIIVGIIFPKLLVPIVPLLLATLVGFNQQKMKNTIFKKPQDIRELEEGNVTLEGIVSSTADEIISPYFQKKCIGYLYREVEYIPTDDGYDNKILNQENECQNFTLTNNTGSIHIKASELDLTRLSSQKKDIHSLKPDVNDIGHIEQVLKDQDHIVIVGNVLKKGFNKYEMAKVNSEPFFVSTRPKIDKQKESFVLLSSLFPWTCILYFVVNYILFFSPDINIPRNDVFIFFSIFGLPLLFVLFWIIGKNKEDLISQFFQYLAGVCILSSFLSFPLLILFYMIKLDFFKVYYTFISVFVITAIALIFNYKKLIEYNKKS